MRQTVFSGLFPQNRSRRAGWSTRRQSRVTRRVLAPRAAFISPTIESLVVVRIMVPVILEPLVPLPLGKALAASTLAFLVAV